MSVVHPGKSDAGFCKKTVVGKFTAFGVRPFSCTVVRAFVANAVFEADAKKFSVGLAARQPFKGIHLWCWV